MMPLSISKAPPEEVARRVDLGKNNGSVGVALLKLGVIVAVLLSSLMRSANCSLWQRSSYLSSEECELGGANVPFSACAKKVACGG